MSSKLLPLFGVLFLCLIPALQARAVMEKSDMETVQVSGVVRLIGSGPIPELVITGPDREWHIPKEEEHKLQNMQHLTVTVEGEETVTALTFANGIPAGERRTLKNIKVISVSMH